MNPEIELKIKEYLEKEREKSDRSYAIKLAETMIFGLATLILLGAIGAILRLIFKN